ncbi:MAG: pilus assembly FimT family protein [Planctomycetota bacterium]|jgi:Tfp pilus assembly protein FimT
MNQSTHFPLRLNSRAKPAVGRRRTGAFTLIEMIIVVGVMVVILGITIPAVTTIWEERKVAEAQNTIQGLLTVARARAVRPDTFDSGLFFYLDADGVQRIQPIVQARPDDVAWQHVFKVTGERDYALPKPIRAVPRYVVDKETSENAYQAFRAEELANEVFFDPPGSVNAEIGQRHRNFFALVYSGDGHLRVNRDVVIQDEDTFEDAVRAGDTTGLTVGVSVSNPLVSDYWPREGAMPVPLDPRAGGGAQGVPDLITDAEGNAINFPSVDGLLIYDDDGFQDAGFGDAAADIKRDYLLRSGIPFYINRLTGTVIRGPVGEVPEES